MKKIAVIFADGCEEVEGLSVVDVLRRLGAECDMVGLTSKDVTGAHNIRITCNKVLDDHLLDYDMVALPGGSEGANNLRANDELRDFMAKRNAEGKWNAAMCAAPIALARFGLLDNADYTCYPGFEKQTKKDAPIGHFKEDITVTDDIHKIVTSRGPATAWAFSYAIAEALGIDTNDLKKAMLYDYLADHIQDSL